MKARSIAREMALLGISQLTDGLGRQAGSEEMAAGLTTRQLDALLVKALTSLGADAQETLEAAEGDLKQSDRMILESETRTVERDEMRDRIAPAIPLVQKAINQAGAILDSLIFAQQEDRKVITSVRTYLTSAAKRLDEGNELLIQQSQRTADIEDAKQAVADAARFAESAIAQLKQALDPENLSTLIQRQDIREYARDLLHKWTVYRSEIDTQLDDAMENWNMRRLPRVDRDILRLAMLEILHAQVPTKVAIDEAIEMSKRYGDEDSYRFINGVLRRTTDKL